MNTDDEVLWSGWLNYCELNSFFRPFKKCWVVLSTSGLLVYSKKEHIKEKRYYKLHELTPFSAVVDTQTELNSITTNFWVTKVSPNMFAMVNPRDTMIAYTDTPNEMHCWVAVIRSAIQRKKKEKLIEDEKKRLAENRLAREKELAQMGAKSQTDEEMEQNFDLQKSRYEETWKGWFDIREEREVRQKEGSMYCVYHKCYHQLNTEEEEPIEDEEIGQREETLEEKNDPNLRIPSLIKKKFFVCQKASCETQCFCSACKCREEQNPPYDPSKPVQVRSLEESDIIINKEIGSGSFSVVYRGEYHGKTVAVKRYISKVVSDSAKRNAVKREVGVLAACKGPLIVGLIGIAANQSSISVVLEYIRFGSVQRHIDQQKMNPLLRMKCILDTARGMHFLHARGIIYRDLKPDNLLLASMDHRSDVCVKIADFGTGRKLPSNREITKHVGTPIYMAPEILLGEEYSLSADLYSFGISAWEIWTLNYAYDEYDSEDKLKDAVCKRLMRPILPESDYDDFGGGEDDLPFAISAVSATSVPLDSHNHRATSVDSVSTENTADFEPLVFSDPQKANSRFSFDGTIFSRLSFQDDDDERKRIHSNKALHSSKNNRAWFVFPKDNDACDFPHPFAPLLGNCWHPNPNERPPFWFVIEIVEEVFLELNRVYELEQQVSAQKKARDKEKEKEIETENRITTK